MQSLAHHQHHIDLHASRRLIQSDDHYLDQDSRRVSRRQEMKLIIKGKRGCWGITFPALKAQTSIAKQFSYLAKGSNDYCEAVFFFRQRLKRVLLCNFPLQQSEFF